MTYDPEIQVIVEINAMSRQWETSMEARLREHGLSHVRWITLWRIAEAETPFNQTDLAKKVGIETSTLVRQLDALEARGLIERVVDKDRRARRIWMTPAGVPVIELVKHIATDLAYGIITDIDPRVLHQVSEVLHTMRDRLRDRDAASGTETA